MPAYDEKRPWYPARGRDPDLYLTGLLHDAVSVISDADPAERAILAGMTGTVLRKSGMIQYASDVPVQRVSWLWPGYLAFRELTAIDGEKGKAKTFVTDDIAARATLGRAMPGQESAVCGPINVIVFTDEGHLASVTVC
jgi:hypothetical protein